jgi:hypothetical protein
MYSRIGSNRGSLLPWMGQLPFAMALLNLILWPTAVGAQSVIASGTTWNDTAGSPIEAHGGGLIKVGSTYYWVGEDHSTANSFSGLNCYSSTDLVNWTFVNDVMPVQSSGLLTSAAVVQRPKILYNAATATYVLWMHVDNSSYSLNYAGVATSPTVCGTYTFIGGSQPLGFPSFDMGVFEDTNGTAYLLTTDNNVGLRIEQMATNYQSVVSVAAELPSMEAPAMLKIGSTYYIFCSHLSGWAANDNEYATATSITGPWSTLKDFAPSGTNTYTSQTNWIEAIAGTGGTTYIYMGDRWNSSSLPTSLADSTYIWLPLTISGDTVSMPWYNCWTLNVAAGTWAITDTSFETGRPVNIVNSATGYCLDVTGASSKEGVQLDAWTCNSGSNQNWTMSAEGSGYYVTSQLDGQVMDDSGASKQSGGAIIQWDANGGTNQQWTFTGNGSGAYTIKSVDSGLCLQPASTAAGALMEQVTCNGSSSQLWKIVD